MQRSLRHLLRVCLDVSTSQKNEDWRTSRFFDHKVLSQQLFSSITVLKEVMRPGSDRKCALTLPVSIRKCSAHPLSRTPKRVCPICLFEPRTANSTLSLVVRELYGDTLFWSWFKTAARQLNQKSEQLESVPPTLDYHRSLEISSTISK